MKIIHSADLHLGSEFKGKLTSDKSIIRRDELRRSFTRLIGYARENSILHIILSGDVFDRNEPFKKDKELFYDALRANPDITFYYLRGNHDIGNSYSENMENLRLFGDEWVYYSIGDDLTICGIEPSDNNTSSRYSALELNKDRKNIVMMHGYISDTATRDGIVIKKLKDKGIDYLALGHIHSYSSGKIDARGRYVYSGCLEGRGFDETGIKGFTVIDTDDMSDSFVPFSQRTVFDIPVDITDSGNAYEAYEIVRKSVKIRSDDILRVTLEGEIAYDDDSLCGDVLNYSGNLCFFVDIVDKTKKNYDVEAISKDLSLSGEFVRTVLESKDYTDEDKRRIINIGLKALRGERSLI